MRSAVMNIETIREFLGWCVVINFGLLVIGLVKLVTLKVWLVKIRAKLFGLDEESVRQIQFRSLMNYSLANLFFNLTPYIALRIMA
ncbi:MAG TPA: hypothetical protein EYQ50_10000 [Verrucomicrobiales bacterium]|nr:hypothetical protein [Verrucomicrobiales bacterium]HIL71797.1 hypothetical protein [Verrucomicrobiota bacterium]